jgi:hypothetical protein
MDKTAEENNLTYDCHGNDKNVEATKKGFAKDEMDEKIQLMAIDNEDGSDGTETDVNV